MLVFEFFTAGVGVAGVVGAVCTFLAFSGLAVLPTRTWAVVVIGLAMLAFSVDVQVGIPRFWTGVGLVFTVIGTWFLFEPLPGASMRPGWIALITGVGGIALTFIVGIYGMNFDPESSPWNMPELRWAYGYPSAMGLMLLVAVA